MAIDSIIASTSIIGCRPPYERASFRNGSCKRRIDLRPFLTTQLKGRRLISTQKCLLPSTIIKSLATELIREEWREGYGLPRDFTHSVHAAPPPSKQSPPPNKADKPSLHNPLLRLERMGCGWLCVIFEWEGVIVEEDPELEKQAWLILAEEVGKSPPPAFVLRRTEGMKGEQAISEVLCWSRDPPQLRRLASRKEEMHRNLHGEFHRTRPGSREFVTALTSHGIPVAVASTRPRRVLEESMAAVGLRNSFSAVVAAEDAHRGKPDPEMFAHVARLLNFTPERCIVVGNSNSSVEAAHDARMKCIAVASKHRMYELGAADLVVLRLDELTVVDLKKLAAVESPEFESGETEMELEEEDILPPSVAVGDQLW
ncbi:hypothetical protein KSP40_PGU008549 [Platanthera guangdongensis]|uniref:Uncharacterized protein n=1 Tax=Platanthera guangdongensis TaxID=2320717 RepID=A0ABR2LMM9_9ASPA